MEKTFTISIPSDQGFIGRKCNSCDKYFKIDSNSLQPTLCCPYCGKNQPGDEMLTNEQKDALIEVAKQESLKIMQSEIDKMFKGITKSSKSFTYKPAPKIRSKRILNHLEKDVDTEILCTSCNTNFQVFGIFGFCPGCGENNIMIYEANHKIIINEIKRSENKQRSLRHAYKDLVSSFELYCRKVARKHQLGETNFQNLQSVRKLFKYHEIDIFSDLDYKEKVAIKRLFEKRHAYEHCGGEITEKYVKNIPDDVKLLGSKAELILEEFTLGLNILEKILLKIRNKYSS